MSLLQDAIIAAAACCAPRRSSGSNTDTNFEENASPGTGLSPSLSPLSPGSALAAAAGGGARNLSSPPLPQQELSPVGLSSGAHPALRKAADAAAEGVRKSSRDVVKSQKAKPVKMEVGAPASATATGGKRGRESGAVDDEEEGSEEPKLDKQGRPQLPRPEGIAPCPRCSSEVGS